ncbi:hypothetical protein ES703_52910 [subsurface metagenome]
MDIIFIKEKDMDFSKFRKDMEIARAFNDDGVCSVCLSPVNVRDEACPYCGVGFGRFFDLNLLEGL